MDQATQDKIMPSMPPNSGIALSQVPMDGRMKNIPNPNHSTPPDKMEGLDVTPPDTMGMVTSALEDQADAEAAQRQLELSATTVDGQEVAPPRRTPYRTAPRRPRKPRQPKTPKPLSADYRRRPAQKPVLARKDLCPAASKEVDRIREEEEARENQEAKEAARLTLPPIVDQVEMVGTPAGTLKSSSPTSPPPAPATAEASAPDPPEALEALDQDNEWREWLNGPGDMPETIAARLVQYFRTHDPVPLWRATLSHGGSMGWHRFTREARDEIAARLDLDLTSFEVVLETVNSLSPAADIPLSAVPWKNMLVSSRGWMILNTLALEDNDYEE